jgi:hypothetical protein
MFCAVFKNSVGKGGEKSHTVESDFYTEFQMNNTEFCMNSAEF